VNDKEDQNDDPKAKLSEWYIKITQSMPYELRLPVPVG
jgi:hypothetical protein